MILWLYWDMGAPFYDIRICLSVSSQTNPFWIRQQRDAKKTGACSTQSNPQGGSLCLYFIVLERNHLSRHGYVEILQKQKESDPPWN